MANQKQTRKIVHSKELKRMIAESSGYHLYEVSDIYDHFIAMLTKQLLEGTIVKIRGLGHFYLTVDKPLTWFSGALQREVHRPVTAKVRFNSDTDLKRSIAIDGELMKLLGKDKYGRKREKTTRVLHGEDEQSKPDREDIQDQS